MRLRALLVAVTACSAAACFSFGDLSGGGDDGASVDSGTDSTSDVDGQVGGDASPSDGAADSGPATAPFCVDHLDATFCADFDESADAMAGFSSLYANDGGIFGFDDEFTSAPRAFFSGNAALLSGASSHAALVRTTGATPTKTIVLDFDLRVDSLDTGGKQVEALAIVNNSATRSSLQMNLTGASSEVGEEIVGLDGGVSYYPHAFAAFATGKYVHVNIAVSTTVLQHMLTVTVDGATRVDHVVMNGSFVFGPVDLYLGNAYAPGPSDGSEIHYDNVTLTLE